MSPIDPLEPITPSELVLLNGERFAKKVMFGNLKLLHTDASVSAAQLGQTILAAAFLANEKIGAIRFDKRKKKAMLGLRKVESLYAVPGVKNIIWPAPSLEADILSLVGRFKDDEVMSEVSKIVYTWLGEDSGSPWGSAVELVKSHMASRDLLDGIEEKKLKILTTTRYELPQSTADLSREYPVEPVESLLKTTESGRPDLWKLLNDQLNSAIKARTEQD